MSKGKGGKPSTTGKPSGGVREPHTSASQRGGRRAGTTGRRIQSDVTHHPRPGD